MNAKRRGCLFLFLLAAACGGADAKADLTKSEAQALVESGDADDTICRDNGFNGDGVCDDWCPDGDTDDCGDDEVCADGDTKDADDGCNTCFCESGVWACTEMACVDPPDNNSNNNSTNNSNGGSTNNSNIGLGGDRELGLTIRECDTDTDGLAIHSAKLSGDKLIVGVGYSGGCEEHVINVCWEGSFMESHPVQARLVMEHDNNGDVCEAYIRERLKVDLTPMRDAYEMFYPSDDDGTIILHVGSQQSVDYDL